MKLFACSVLMVFHIVRFFHLLYIDIEGKPVQEPTGFLGAVGTIIAMGISTILFYYAGLYDIFIEMIQK